MIELSRGSLRFCVSVFLWHQFSLLSTRPLSFRQQRDRSFNLDNRSCIAICRLHNSSRQRARGIHASPDGKRIYVALSDNVPMIESAGDRIGVVDVASRRVVARFRAAATRTVRRHARRKVLYTSNEDAGSASATDIRSGKVVATMVVGIEPEGVSVSPNGRWAYVTAETSNSVSIIDTRSNKVVSNCWWMYGRVQWPSRRWLPRVCHG
jgi:YVTN family beta-propeller protein